MTGSRQPADRGSTSRRGSLNSLHALLACLVFLTGVSGCTLIDSFLTNTSQMTAEELIMEANAAMQNKE